MHAQSRHHAPLRTSASVRISRCLALSGVLFPIALEVFAQEDPRAWPVHSMERPVPAVVTPGPAGAPVPPPSDAIVLFSGTDLSAWRNQRGGGSAPAGWKVENGYFEVVPGVGGIQTAESFGDVQLHVEWATPTEIVGESQGRGNSGVFLGGSRYEVQVLDSYNNRTYADGQAAAIYAQYPPLVNATRAPGEWQSYDIIYRGPRFDDSGALTRPATMTVFHNGILVQDHVELIGPTGQARADYSAHSPRQPISLQDHTNPVRYRNIWLRELGD